MLPLLLFLHYHCYSHCLLALLLLFMLHVHILVAIRVAFSHCLLIVLLLLFSCCYYCCCCFSHFVIATLFGLPFHTALVDILASPSLFFSCCLLTTALSSFLVMPLSLFSHYPYCSFCVVIVAFFLLSPFLHFKYLMAQLLLFFVHCCYYVSLVDMVLPLPLPRASRSLKL